MEQGATVGGEKGPRFNEQQYDYCSPSQWTTKLHRFTATVDSRTDMPMNALKGVRLTDDILKDNVWDEQRNL